MLFAAGLGTRMGSLTADRPKPLINVAGKPLIDHALALTGGAEVGRRVVNLHYRGDQIKHHLAGQDITLSWEREEILETGGGLRAALPLLGDGPVMTLNTDAVWTGANPLAELAGHWADHMGALLLLAPAGAARGYGGAGDFLLEQGRIRRANGALGLVYLGAQILRTEALMRNPQRVFSLNWLWDEMIAEGRAYGLIHRGGWCDVGQPDGIALAEAMLADV